MMLKNISPDCGVRASVMLFFLFPNSILNMAQWIQFKFGMWMYPKGVTYFKVTLDSSERLILILSFYCVHTSYPMDNC